MARNQAELGWKKVFRKVLQLLIKHQDTPKTIRMRGKAVEIDPRHWNADMDVSINVGLGTGSRDRDMQMLQLVKQDQVGLAERFAAGGFPEKALDMLPYIMTTMTKSAEAAGIKSPELFFPEIKPEEIDAGKQQLEQMKQQGDPKIALEKEKLGIEVQKTQMQMQMDAAKGEQDILLQREKMQGEIELKRQQMAMEFELKRWQIGEELALKRQLSMEEMQMKREQGFYHADTQAEVGRYKANAASSVHMGGQPG